MKRIRVSLCLNRQGPTYLVILFLFTSAVKGAAEIKQAVGTIKSNSVADSVWATMPKYFWPDFGKYLALTEKEVLSEDEKEKMNELNIAWHRTADLHQIRLWNWGVKFWHMFPHDRRRFQWFLMGIYPQYYKNIDQGAKAEINQTTYSAPLDLHRRANWLRQYYLFRQELLNSPEVSRVEKEEIIKQEIIRERSDQANVYIRQQMGKWDYRKWVRKAAKFARYWYPNVYAKDSGQYLTGDLDWLQGNFINATIEHAAALSLSYSQQIAILKAFEVCGVDRLEAQAQKKLTLLLLEKHPFNFSGYTMDGRYINTKSLRGKVVLVDFWNTRCSGCIQFMYSAKEPYEKYRDRGFEIISVCADFAGLEQKALEIHKRIGADWPIVYFSKYDSLYNAFGWVGAPQLLLLGKDGRLIMYSNTILAPGGLDALLEKEFRN
jgi:thiol-disulfide isomerase/thioredoxin